MMYVYPQCLLASMERKLKPCLKAIAYTNDCDCDILRVEATSVMCFLSSSVCFHLAKVLILPCLQFYLGAPDPHKTLI